MTPRNVLRIPVRDARWWFLGASYFKYNKSEFVIRRLSSVVHETTFAPSIETFLATIQGLSENTISLPSSLRTPSATIGNLMSNPRHLHNRFPPHHQIHRRKQLLPASSNKSIASIRKLPRRLRRPHRRKSQRLHHRQQKPNPQPSNFTHPHIPE